MAPPTEKYHGKINKLTESEIRELLSAKSYKIVNFVQKVLTFFLNRLYQGNHE